VANLEYGEVLEYIMARREAELRGYRLDSETWAEERALASMMQPTINKGKKLGKRPISRQGTLNQQIIAKSPGDRHKGLDFIKAVYSDKTGQEQEDWTMKF